MTFQWVLLLLIAATPAEGVNKEEHEYRCGVVGSGMVDWVGKEMWITWTSDGRGNIKQEFAGELNG
ncbi:hypothetical protein KY285_022878 [Solanum tuberosum]|nr:hypothetical protein KY285_022878 [Solanum tuberosum]